MSRFRIYYDDGGTYSGDPFYAKPAGVICVVQEQATPTGWAVRYNRDAFFWKDGRWYECDQFGLHDYWMQHIGPKVSLFGRYVRDELFWDVMKRAQSEGLG